jgi:hypothetical protein
MLRNISCVGLILSLIIFKQRICSSVAPPLTEEAPLFVFSPPTMFTLRTGPLTFDPSPPIAAVGGPVQEVQPK